tara:strand:+ start:1732 stop:1911 length:180 start_codon:yes stop_codon:yes gene_type:complete
MSKFINHKQQDQKNMFLQDNDFLLIVFQCKFDLGKLVLIGQYIMLPQIGWVMINSRAKC